MKGRARRTAHQNLELLQKVKPVLEQRRQDLMRALNREPNGMRACMFTGIHPVGALGRADVDITAQLTEVESAVLCHVQEALARIEQGVYGRCADCGKEISVVRLLALPHAPCCVACQRMREQEELLAVTIGFADAGEEE